MPDVGVVTLNKGRGAHLRRLVEGLSRGACPRDCIVVEMGGDASALPATPFPLRRVPLDAPGLPLAAARNAGRRATTASRLVFLDVDCIPSGDLVEALDNALTASDALICCDVTYLPADAVQDGWTEAQLADAGRPHPARVFPRHRLAPAPRPGLFWSLAFGVRAATYDRLGGFDETFTGYGAEDTDLAFRAEALGVPILFSPRGRAFHQRHAAHDPPLQHFADIMDNACRFHARHGVWPMAGWIEAFVAMGLVRQDADAGFVVLRRPTPAEIAASAIAPDRPF